jgi:hypothetical protein
VSPRRRLCLFGGRTNHRARGESSRQRSTDHVHGGVSEGGGPIASASTVTLPPMSFITRRAAPHSSSYCVSKSSRPLRRSAGSSSWRYLGGQEILERQGAVGAEAEVQRRPHEADLREPDVPREEPERGEAQVERVPAEERGAVTVSDREPVNRDGEREGVHPHLRDRDVAVERSRRFLHEQAARQWRRGEEAERGVDHDESADDRAGAESSPLPRRRAFSENHSVNPRAWGTPVGTRRGAASCESSPGVH